MTRSKLLSEMHSQNLNANERKPYLTDTVPFKNRVPFYPSGNTAENKNLAGVSRGDIILPGRSLAKELSPINSLTVNINARKH